MTHSSESTATTAKPGETELAVQMLEIAARFHAAQGDPIAWKTALDSCRDWFDCSEAPAIAPELPVTPERLIEFAESISHCAKSGTGKCGGGKTSAGEAHRLCQALAPHLEISVAVLRQTLQTRLFDRRLPTWIVSRDGVVREASLSAEVLTQANEEFGLDQGRLAPRMHGAAPRLWAMLPALNADALFTLPGRSGQMTTLRLRPHPQDDAVIVTLVDDADNTGETARQLATLLGLTPRQSELAAHLLAGHSLAACARTMEISRDTAKDHFTSLRQKTGAADRPELIATLRRSLHGG